MFTEALNPSHFIQPQYALTGSAVMPSAPVNPASVTPLFNLPDQGNRLDDKASKNAPQSPEKVEGEDTSEERNPLLLLETPPDFQGLLRAFLNNGFGSLFLLRDRLRRRLGIDFSLPLADAALRGQHLFVVRSRRYSTADRFFVQPPGWRYRGAI